MLLEELCGLYLNGMKKPLPFFVDCYDGFSKGESTEDSLVRAKAKWFPGYNNFNPLSQDEAVLVCFGEEFPGDNPLLVDSMVTAFETVQSIYTRVWEAAADE